MAPQQTSVYDLAIVQSRLFGDNKGNQFNDLEKVIGYPASITIEVEKPLSAIKVMYGEVVDGIKITYLTEDNQSVDITHGTSDSSSDPNLKKTLVSFNNNESIVAVSGKHGSTSAFGIRITQLTFIIYDSSTGALRAAGPFGSGLQGSPFHVTANGSLVSFGGFAIDTNSSLGQLQREGKAGGLYGLTFAEVAYRST